MTDPTVTLPAVVDWPSTVHALRTGALSPLTVWHDPDPGLLINRWSVLTYAMSRSANDLPASVMTTVLHAWQAAGASIDTDPVHGPRHILSPRHVLDVVTDPEKAKAWLDAGGNLLGRCPGSQAPAWWGAMVHGQIEVLEVLRAHPRWAVAVQGRRIDETRRERGDALSTWADGNPHRIPLDDRARAFAWLWQYLPDDDGKRPAASTSGRTAPLGWVHALMDQAAMVWNTGRTDASPSHPLNLWRRILATSLVPDDAPWLTQQVTLWQALRNRNRANWAVQQTAAVAEVAPRALRALEGLELCRGLDDEALSPALDRAARARL